MIILSWKVEYDEKRSHKQSRDHPEAKKELNIQEESTIIYFTAPLSINLPSSRRLFPSIHISPPITMPEQKRKIDEVVFALADLIF